MTVYDGARSVLALRYDLLQQDMDEVLFDASVEGHLEVVKVLLAAGAYVHAQNDKALMESRSRLYFPIVHYLEEYMKREVD